MWHYFIFNHQPVTPTSSALVAAIHTSGHLPLFDQDNVIELNRVPHQPMAVEEARMLMVEPVATVRRGDCQYAITIDNLG